MASSTSLATTQPAGPRSPLTRVLDALSMPLLAILSAFLLGAIAIWLTSGKFATVVEAYDGLIRGALFKQRGLSETLLATTPYIFLSLGVALGFKSGLFNIGVEGQFYVGALSAAFVGATITGLPAIIHLPLTLLAGVLGGAVWAGIPGYLKAKAGAHEVITTIMLNYVAALLLQFLVGGPMRDTHASAPQTVGVAPAAQLWSLASIPQRLQDPLNALGVALVTGLLVFLALRVVLQLPSMMRRLPNLRQRSLLMWGASVLVAVAVFVGLPPLVRLVWPFRDQYDRLNIGLLLALLAAVFVWWLMWKTTIGFELRTVGANPNAARYAGVNITRNIVLAMALSGGLAGIAGAVEMLGVTGCGCLPQIFSSGYGFDSIAIALLGKNNPLGIVFSSLLFGAMRNGSDLMELSSGVSKYVISIIQAFVLLFVAAPSIVRWAYRIRTGPRPEDEAPLTRGWGG